MIAHRALWIDKAGVLCKEPPDEGMKIATAEGNVIPEVMVKQHRLVAIQRGKKLCVEQTKKAVEKPKDKSIPAPTNKGARGSGGLSVTDKKGNTRGPARAS